MPLPIPRDEPVTKQTQPFSNSGDDVDDDVDDDDEPGIPLGEDNAWTEPNKEHSSRRKHNSKISAVQL